MEPYYVTYFDLDSRRVEAASHECGAARGFGFRNYWFGTLKNVIEHLPTLMRR